MLVFLFGFMLMSFSVQKHSPPESSAITIQKQKQNQKTILSGAAVILTKNQISEKEKRKTSKTFKKNYRYIKKEALEKYNQINVAGTEKIPIRFQFAS